MNEIKENIKKIDDPFAALDEIANLGRVETEIKITDKLSLIITTLTAEEENEVFIDCQGYQGIGYITKNKIETLARCIKGINGKRFNYNEINDIAKRKEERKKAVIGLRDKIESWRDDLVTYVYEQWLDITGNSEEKLKKLGLIAAVEVKKRLEQMKTNLTQMEEDSKEELEKAKESELKK